jgi:hypothetical protein
MERNCWSACGLAAIHADDLPHAIADVIGDNKDDQRQRRTNRPGLMSIGPEESHSLLVEAIDESIFIGPTRRRSSPSCARSRVTRRITVIRRQGACSRVLISVLLGKVGSFNLAATSAPASGSPSGSMRPA